MGRRKKNTTKAISMAKSVEMKKPRSKRKFFANYSEGDVKNSLQAIRDGTPIATASKLYNVPRTTLRNKLHGRAPETSGRVGRECVLGREVEEKLEQWLLETGKMGFPVNKDSHQGLVFVFMNSQYGRLRSRFPKRMGIGMRF